jgi:hypothetical protein
MTVCCYCRELINADEDSQKVNKHAAAHTDCAFGADVTGWAVVDAMEAQNVKNPEACNLGVFPTA